MTWLKNTYLPTKYLHTYPPTYLPNFFSAFLAFHNSSIGCPLLGPLVGLLPLTIRVFTTLQRPVTFETFDQSDEETWPGRQIQIQRQSPFKTFEALVYLLSLKKSSLQIIPMCNITHFSNRDKRAILKLNLDGKMAFPILNTFIIPLAPKTIEGETFGVQVSLYGALQPSGWVAPVWRRTWSLVRSYIF